MSRELLEFSDMIDEQFEFTEIEIEKGDFWDLMVNLFI
ncbi:MAG: hypothetical protein JWP44_839 [Mucilaginibacter sp.]|nr:hypothetical protein [Mucilaginibacter sp.]